MKIDLENNLHFGILAGLLVLGSAFMIYYNFFYIAAPIAPTGNVISIQPSDSTNQYNTLQNPQAGTSLGGHNLLLQVPLDQTSTEREAFRIEFKKHSGEFTEIRPLYKEYIDTIGANGIIQVIKEEHPKCHYEGHELGKEIQERIGDIGTAIATCDNSCYSGCFHGVMMGAFSPKEAEAHEHEPGTSDDHEHVSLDEIKKSIPDVCFSDIGAITPGDCAHGVGHAIMYTSRFDIETAMDLCETFGEAGTTHYCATGAYMEHTTRRKEKDGIDSNFDPCDESSYPAACFFNKIGKPLSEHFSSENKGTIEGFANKCMELEGNYRLGCFYGMGNGFMTQFVLGKQSFDTVCNFGTDTDQKMCLHGALERMSKYHMNVAFKRCDILTGWKRDVCMAGAGGGMYNLHNKDFDNFGAE